MFVSMSVCVLLCMYACMYVVHPTCCAVDVLYSLRVVQSTYCIPDVLCNRRVVQPTCCTTDVLYSLRVVQSTYCTADVLYNRRVVQPTSCTVDVLYSRRVVQPTCCTRRRVHTDVPRSPTRSFRVAVTVRITPEMLCVAVQMYVPSVLVLRLTRNTVGPEKCSFVSTCSQLYDGDGLSGDEQFNVTDVRMRMFGPGGDDHTVMSGSFSSEIQYSGYSTVVTVQCLEM